MLKKLTAIVLCLAMILTGLLTMAFAETLQTTDKEFTFMDLPFGTKYSVVQKTIKNVNGRFSNRYVPMSSGLSSYDEPELFAKNGFPFLQSKDNIELQQGPNSSVKDEIVGGHKVGAIWIGYAPFSLDEVSFKLRNENDYEMIYGQYSFQFSDHASYANDGRKTSMPFAEGKNLFSDLKSKLTKLYGDPIVINGEISEKDNQGKTYNSDYAIWIGANKTGIILKYLPKSHDNYHTCYIHLLYTRSDINEMIEQYEGNKGYEGL